MNTNQKAVLQILASYIPGIDQSKLQQWLQFTEGSDIANAAFFVFEDLRLADMYFEEEEDLASASGYYFQEGNLVAYWEEVYCSDGSKLEDDDEFDPRSFFLGVIDMSDHTYLRLNGYGESYEFNLNESDSEKKDENPDFTDWIKDG